MDSIDLIERYFENSLTEVELKDFQRRLETDDEFAAAFQLEQDLMEGIEVMGNQNLKVELKEIYKEEIEQKESSKPKTISRRLWLTVAASIAVLIVAIWLFNRPSPERLYATYFQPEFDFVEKGAGDDLVSKAEVALKRGDYAGALPLLDRLLDLEPENDSEYLLAKGIALVETGKFNEGIQIYNRLKNKPLSEADALWYEALAYLKQGKFGECKNVLSKITDRWPPAKQLLNDLQKIN